jgi:ABC-type antimicrobial peptide transport system permease subunit
MILDKYGGLEMLFTLAVIALIAGFMYIICVGFYYIWSILKMLYRDWKGKDNGKRRK